MDRVKVVCKFGIVLIRVFSTDLNCLKKEPIWIENITI